jgi:hypothetical protein
MARQLAITKKTYLDGFEGWDSDCYVEWRPVTYGDSLALKSLSVDDGDEVKAFQAIFELTKKHIVGGKVKIIGEDGQAELADYEDADLDQMPPEMINRIFADITGAQFADPKDTPTKMEESPIEPATSEPSPSGSSTETPSSEI